MSSNVSTPYLEPTPSHGLAPPSPSPLVTFGTTGPSSSASASVLDDLPPLSISILTSKDDKISAVKLVADSIAQQRQQTSLNLVFHPLCLAGLALALALAYQFSWVYRSRDLGLTLTLSSGVVMSYLLSIRYFASPYIKLAESLNMDFLVSDDGEEDLVLGTKFGDEIIGSLVLRLELNPSLAGKKKNRSLSLKGGKGVIRAWTTKLRYRKRGVGGDMLAEAVRVTKERCGRDAEVGFAQEHANSKMVLREMFNGSFRRTERMAQRMLEAQIGEWEGRRKK